jgi:hypothetical protein
LENPELQSVDSTPDKPAAISNEVFLMRIKTRTVLLACSLIVVLSSGGAAFGLGQLSSVLSQGLTLHKETNSSGMMGRGGGTMKSTIYFSSKGMRMTSEGGNDILVLLEEGKFITIDHTKKSYTELDPEQLQTAIDNATAKMGEDQEQMEAMRQMMGNVSADFAVAKQGAGGTIAGYATEKYLVTGPVSMEIWAAPELAVPASYYDALKVQMPRNPLFDTVKMYEEFKKIDGITLKEVMTMNMMGMSFSTTSVVTSVEKGPIPGSRFEIPAGYKAVPFKY